MLADARRRVMVGATYRHTKSGGCYIITGLAILEATDEVAVRYAPVADDSVEFIRPLKSFTEQIELKGETVPRFTLHTD